MGLLILDLDGNKTQSLHPGKEVLVTSGFGDGLYYKMVMTDSFLQGDNLSTGVKYDEINKCFVATGFLDNRRFRNIQF
jgi:hypothetical protein